MWLLAALMASLSLVTAGLFARAIVTLEDSPARPYAARPAAPDGLPEFLLTAGR
jgi:hypothetical protein